MKKTRTTVLSPLQEEFFKLVVEGIEADPVTMEIITTEEEWDAYIKALRKDISTMDAIDLRKNIKIWKETAC